MLVWHRRGSDKSLYFNSISEIEALNYKKLIKVFYKAVESANSKINKALYKNLNDLVDSQEFLCNENDLYGGYIGLYRWCVTEHKRDRHARPEARAVWEYLFGVLPSVCLAEPPQTGKKPKLNEDAWHVWIESIVQGFESTIGEEEEANSCEQKYLEGVQKYKYHRRIERNKKLVEDKKASVSSLACEVCNFDFEAQYGVIGKKFAECHHIVPLEQINGEVENQLSDLAILCSNCHRMIHRNGVMTLEDLRKMLTRLW